MWDNSSYQFSSTCQHGVFTIDLISDKGLFRVLLMVSRVSVMDTELLKVKNLWRWVWGGLVLEKKVLMAKGLTCLCMHEHVCVYFM